MASGGLHESPWQAQGGEKRALVRDLFAEIAPVYDRLNSLMSLRLHHRWRAAAVRKLALQNGETALDLCCGTGDFLLPLRRAAGPAGRLVGIDFCEPMLRRARAKDAAAALGLGDACRLPIRDEAVHAVTVGWGIRNVPDIDVAHREIARCLKPGGRFVSLDMAIPRNPLVRIASGWACSLLPVLGRLVGQKRAYTYLPRSAQLFWSRERLARSMEEAGFSDVGWKDLMFGNICLHWGTKR